MKAFAIVTAAVLLVIGIGIGVVGGLTYAAPPSHTYGTAAFRFSAAYPNYLGGKLRYAALPVRRYATGTPALAYYDLFTDSYSASVTWVRQDTAVGGKVLRTLLDGLLTGYRTRTFSGGGVTTTLATAACGIGATVGFPVGSCFDAEIIRAGRVTWVVEAASTSATPQLARDFVRSFHTR